MVEALDIQVTGIVQGVGFRPFIYRLAMEHSILGWVLNATDGVFIHAEGEAADLDRFVIEISERPPAASRVEQIELAEVPLEGFTDFQIRFSDDADVERTTLVSPDLATCDDCLRELFDPQDRRYRYPFINCTNCGPRFTIIDSLPYDRPKTSMKGFPMCPTCQAEYGDPLDRRFHAQPDACFDCGPHLSYCELGDEGPLAEPEWGLDRAASDALIARACELIGQGGILAVKGLGGFHLACDAANEEAVRRLRVRKRREGKAFALMVPGIEAARELCFVSPEEERALLSPARPIVLLRRRPNVRGVAPSVAEGLRELGIMLPATPLQHLLLADSGKILVMTSGNVHDEPIQVDDAQAVRALAGIADALLGNDRPILSRFDDSVVRLFDAGEGGSIFQFIRRARGFAPLPIPLPDQGKRDEKGEKGEKAKQAEARSEGVAAPDPSADAAPAGEPASDAPDAAGSAAAPSVLAVGPQQKATLCLTRPGEAFVSQHIGDLDHPATQDAWHAARERFERLFELKPQVIACDLHPEYHSAKWARAQGLPLVEVQHHHAHLVSAMAENGLAGPVCGFAFDGTGFGTDGCIWGGEVLLANLGAFERLVQAAYFPLPGGAAAIRDLSRCAYGALWALDLLEHPAAARVLDALGPEGARLCGEMVEKGINSPLTSSVGRLFDAASALLGICAKARYEGEGAVLLEAAIDPDDESPFDERYRIELVKNVAQAGATAQDTAVALFDYAGLFLALLDDIAAGVPASFCARQFHEAFVRAILDAAALARAAFEVREVVLAGGVFMNRYLAEHAIDELIRAGYIVAVNRELPPNDGSIAFGQAVVALQAEGPQIQGSPINQ